MKKTTKTTLEFARNNDQARVLVEVKNGTLTLYEIHPFTLGGLPPVGVITPEELNEDSLLDSFELKFHTSKSINAVIGALQILRRDLLVKEWNEMSKEYTGSVSIVPFVIELGVIKRE